GGLHRAHRGRDLQRAGVGGRSGRGARDHGPPLRRARAGRVSPVRVLVAPDSFKGTLDAARVAWAVRRGWLSVRPEDEVRSLPLADGGEGSLEVLAAALEGSTLETVPLVHGP